MASSSSRWKRFAFFDRKNLSLPTAVWEDVSPGDIGQNDAISLAVTSHACIQTATAPVTDSISPSVSLEYSDIQKSLIQIPSSLDGMIRSLKQSRDEGITASTSIDSNILVFHGEGKGSQSLSSVSPSSNYDGYLCLAFLSSKSTSVVHCIDLTSRCFPLSQNRATPSVSSVANAKDEDGWRGSFDPFVYGRVEESLPSTYLTPSTSSSSNTAPLSSSSIAPTTTSHILGLAVASSPMTLVEDENSSRFQNSSLLSTAFQPKNIYVACITDSPSSVGVCVHRNPHWYLSSSTTTLKATNIVPRTEILQPVGKFDYKNRGIPTCVHISCHAHSEEGIVVVGTDKGLVLVYTFPLYSTSGKTNVNPVKIPHKLNFVMEIPSPYSLPSHSVGFSVTNLRLVRSRVSEGSKHTTPVRKKTSNVSSSSSYPSSVQQRRSKLFVTYHRLEASGNSSLFNPESTSVSTTNLKNGVCCYDLGVLGWGGSMLSSPSARYDLDFRDVASSNLCDFLPSSLYFALNNLDPGTSTNASRKISTMSSIPLEDDGYLMIARYDGLYIYSTHEKVKVIPLEQGEKNIFCCLPPSQTPRKFSTHKEVNSDRKNEDSFETGLSSNILLVMAEGKSSRDSVNIYDLTQRLVGYHTLLSPTQICLRAVGISTPLLSIANGNVRGGLSSCVTLTNTGTLVTITEKCTAEKVSLLVQKQLYSAAISIALSDVHYKSCDVTQLYKLHAEHLFLKGEFQAAMDQFMYTIGSLEPSYIIYRYLDAPRLPSLTRYLEEIRLRGLSTPMQDELLRTCYLHLNDASSAEKVTVSISSTMTSIDSTTFVSNLLDQPSQAFAALCSLEANKTAETIYAHGPALVRSLPYEMASLVISLSEGTYSPGNFLDKKFARLDPGESNPGKMIRSESKCCDQYPIELFANAFLEHPKLLRTILSYCCKHNIRLIPSLKCTYLELTLEEWNHARSVGDFELEAARHVDAITFLTDPKNADMGESEALVIVELAGFSDGQTLFHERLNLTSYLIHRYAKDGTEKARRQMLALSRNDPEALAMVLSKFVEMATIQSDHSKTVHAYDYIHEALDLIHSQGKLPGARVARILAGQHYGPFSNQSSNEESNGIPLSAAMDYFGKILESSSHSIHRLKTDINEYIQLCHSMQKELDGLLSGDGLSGSPDDHNSFNFDVDRMYQILLDASGQNISSHHATVKINAEDFWRELEQNQDRFETMARVMSCGILE